MTNLEKIDLLLKLTEVKISLPKISLVRERGQDGRMTDVPKITGGIEVSLFGEQDLMLFRTMIQKEVRELLPFEPPKKENPAQLAMDLETETDHQTTQG